MTRFALALSLFGLVSCAGHTFENASVQTYSGTWGFSLSQVNLSCSSGTQQSFGGSGKLVVSIATDQATNLSVDLDDGCTAEFTRDLSGFTLVAPTDCSLGHLQSMHIAVDEQIPDTLNYTSSIMTTMADGSTCTRVESASATRN